MSAITITIPEIICNKIKELVARDHSSIEQFAVLAAAEKMSSIVTSDYLEERAHRAKPGRLRELLKKAPKNIPHDEDIISTISHNAHK